MDNIQTPHDISTQIRTKAAKKSTLVSVIVNIFLSFFQVIAGLFSGSQGLIADGIHSFSDLLADFIVLFANKKSQKPRDSDHPYGHWRYETGAALIIGGILCAVGLGMLWSAIGKLHHPETIAEVHAIALWVALAALVVKESLFRYMLAVANRVRSSLLVANAWHARSDAASSVVVAIGIIGNLLGLPYCDPLAALVVGLLVLRMGYVFAANALHDLMDRGVAAPREQAIRDILGSLPGILGFHDLKTRKAGDFILLDVHIEVASDLSVKQGHELTVQVQNALCAADDIISVMVHVDPVSPAAAHISP